MKTSIRYAREKDVMTETHCEREKEEGQNICKKLLQEKVARIYLNKFLQEKVTQKLVTYRDTRRIYI